MNEYVCLKKIKLKYLELIKDVEMNTFYIHISTHFLTVCKHIQCTVARVVVLKNSLKVMMNDKQLQKV